MKKLILPALLALVAAAPASADTFPRKMIIEHFTTLQCSNCPEGLVALNGAVNNDPNVVWVSHHVGFGEDELTVKDSNKLMNYGVTGAPNVMFDRMQTELNSLVFVPHALGAETMRQIIDNRLASEANVGIDVTTDYDPDTRLLKVSVKLERNADLPADALLSVQLVENAVKAKRPQAGSNGYFHSHVFRQTLTDIMGDEIEWADDNTATTTYEATLPENWRQNFVYAVAFVNRPISRVIADNEVLNAQKTEYITTEAGIEGIGTDNADAPVEWYTLQGIRVANPSAAGVYVRRQGTDASKVMVR